MSSDSISSNENKIESEISSDVDNNNNSQQEGLIILQELTQKQEINNNINIQAAYGQTLDKIVGLLEILKQQGEEAAADRQVFNDLLRMMITTNSTNSTNVQSLQLTSAAVNITVSANPSPPTPNVVLKVPKHEYGELSASDDTKKLKDKLTDNNKPAVAVVEQPKKLPNLSASAGEWVPSLPASPRSPVEVSSPPAQPRDSAPVRSTPKLVDNTSGMSASAGEFVPSVPASPRSPSEAQKLPSLSASAGEWVPSLPTSPRSPPSEEIKGLSLSAAAGEWVPSPTSYPPTTVQTTPYHYQQRNTLIIKTSSPYSDTVVDTGSTRETKTLNSNVNTYNQYDNSSYNNDHNNDYTQPAEPVSYPDDDPYYSTPSRYPTDTDTTPYNFTTTNTNRGASAYKDEYSTSNKSKKNLSYSDEKKLPSLSPAAGEWVPNGSPSMGAIPSLRDYALATVPMPQAWPIAAPNSYSAPASPRSPAEAAPYSYTQAPDSAPVRSSPKVVDNTLSMNASAGEFVPSFTPTTASAPKRAWPLYGPPSPRVPVEDSYSQPDNYNSTNYTSTTALDPQQDWPLYGPPPPRVLAADPYQQPQSRNKFPPSPRAPVDLLNKGTKAYTKVGSKYDARAQAMSMEPLPATPEPLW